MEFGGGEKGGKAGLNLGEGSSTRKEFPPLQELLLGGGDRVCFSQML